jgi:hypothetical protein
VSDRRLEEVSGGVAFVVSATLPMVERPGRLVATGVADARQGERSLHVAVGLLRGEDDRNPFVQRRAHIGLRAHDVRVSLRVEHQRDRHRLHGVVDVRISEHISFVLAMRFAAQLLSGLDKVVEPTGGDVSSLELLDAVRDPAHGQRLHPMVPQRVVDRPLSHVDYVELLCRRRRLDLHFQRGRRRGATAVARHQFEDVDARFAHRCRGD